MKVEEVYQERRQRMKLNISEKAVKLLVILAFVVLIMRYVESEELRAGAVFMFYLAACLIYRIDPRYSIISGAALLLISAVLMGQGKPVLADRFAIYSYYFLFTGVILTAAEHARETISKPSPPPPSQQPEARVIAITSGKGGVGKTTLTVNLGVALSELGRKVLLIDLDLGMPNLDMTMGIRGEGLRCVLDGRGEPESVMSERYGCRVLATLPVDGAYRRTDTPEKLRDIIKTLRHRYDFVLLDFPPGQEALHVIDDTMEVLVIANPEKLSIADALNTISTLKEKTNVLGVVINKADEADVDAVEELLSVPVLAVLPEEAVMQEAVEEEEPLYLRERSCRFSQEIGELARFIAGYRAVTPEKG